MLKRIRGTEKQKALLLGGALAALHIGVILCCGLRTFTFETRTVSALLFAIACVVALLHIPLCLYLRTKKYSWIARGIFDYQFLGCVAFLLFFVGYVAGHASAAFFEGCYALFRWWTLPYAPALVTVCRVTGIPFKFIAGIFYIILTELSAYTVTAIRKDIRYERERAEVEAYVEATRGSGGHF